MTSCVEKDRWCDDSLTPPARPREESSPAVRSIEEAGRLFSTGKMGSDEGGGCAATQRLVFGGFTFWGWVGCWLPCFRYCVVRPTT